MITAIVPLDHGSSNDFYVSYKDLGEIELRTRAMTAEDFRDGQRLSFKLVLRRKADYLAVEQQEFLTDLQPSIVMNNGSLSLQVLIPFMGVKVDRMNTGWTYSYLIDDDLVRMITYSSTPYTFEIRFPGTKDVLIPFGPEKIFDLQLSSFYVEGEDKVLKRICQIAIMFFLMWMLAGIYSKFMF